MSENLYLRSGIWYGRLQVNGRDVRRSLFTGDRVEAEARLTDLKREALARVPAPQMLRRNFIASLQDRDARGRWVYFIQAEDGGAIKIGYAINVQRRLRDIQATALGKSVRVLAAIKGGPEIERTIHERFAKERLNGEWFRPSMRLMRFIEALSAAHEPDHRATVSMKA